MNYEINGNDLLYYIKEDEFSVNDTLDCGQCFRFDKICEKSFVGVHLNKRLHITQFEDYVLFKDTSEDDFLRIWCDFFDLHTDYSEIKSQLSFDPTINAAISYCPGIRILRQDAWEAICSFIISQNNNIPRIKGIIARLCENFGNYICEEEGKGALYTFPSAEVLAQKTVSDLECLRAGFRAKYIIDAATKIASGQIDVMAIKQMELTDAQKSLEQIVGVGPKVAQCALLFGFYRMEAFPIDVWIKKALDYFYADGFPKEASHYAGIAQQYIFHYIRSCDHAIPQEYKK